MALSKVGTAAAVQATALAADGTLTVTFVPDGVWNTNDYLVFLCAGGAGDNNQFAMIDNPADVAQVTSTWDIFGDYIWQTSYPYWFIIRHFVTSGEAGSGNLTCTVTLKSLFGVTPGATGFLLTPGGVAVRGGTSEDVNGAYAGPGGTLSYISGSSSVRLSAASPASSDAPMGTQENLGTVDGTAGAVQLFAAGNINSKTFTGSSFVWSGTPTPTELSDVFSQDALEGGATDYDFLYSGAYSLLDTNDTRGADDLVHTYAIPSGVPTTYGIRCCVELDGPGIPESNKNRYTRRRFADVGLPYDLSTVRLGGRDATQGAHQHSSG